MPKLLYGLLLCGVLGAGCLSRTTPTTNSASSTPATTSISHELRIQHQIVNGQILVESVRLGQPGFVAIQMDANGRPGTIVGSSGILGIGQHANIHMNIPASVRGRLWGVLYLDNGDQLFSPLGDTPASTAQKKTLSIPFTTATSSAALDAQRKDEEKQALEYQTDLNSRIMVHVEGNGPDTSVKSGKTVNVSLEHQAFSPSTVIANKGDKVVFTNNDSVLHTVTADDKGFTSGPLHPAQIFILQTADMAVGSYPFHSEYRSDVKGRLIVQEE